MSVSGSFSLNAIYNNSILQKTTNCFITLKNGILVGFKDSSFKTRLFICNLKLFNCTRIKKAELIQKSTVGFALISLKDRENVTQLYFMNKTEGEKAFVDTMKAVDYCSPKMFGVYLSLGSLKSGKGVPLPISVSLSALKHLEFETTEGVFRISASSSEVQKLKLAFDSGEDLNENSFESAHSAANIIKLYLRELPDPLIPFYARADWLNAINESIDEIDDNLADLLADLPEVNKKTLFYLVSLLCSVVENEKITRMSARTLGVVLGPTILGTGKDKDKDKDEFDDEKVKETENAAMAPEDAEEIENATAIVTRLIAKFKDIFAEMIEAEPAECEIKARTSPPGLIEDDNVADFVKNNICEDEEKKTEDKEKKTEDKEKKKGKEKDDKKEEKLNEKKNGLKQSKSNVKEIETNSPEDNAKKEEEKKKREEEEERKKEEAKKKREEEEERKEEARKKREEEEERKEEARKKREEEDEKKKEEAKRKREEEEQKKKEEEEKKKEELRKKKEEEAARKEDGKKKKEDEKKKKEEEKKKKEEEKKKKEEEKKKKKEEEKKKKKEEKVKEKKSGKKDIAHTDALATLDALHDTDSESEKETENESENEVEQPSTPVNTKKLVSPIIQRKASGSKPKEQETEKTNTEQTVDSPSALQHRQMSHSNIPAQGMGMGMGMGIGLNDIQKVRLKTTAANPSVTPKKVEPETSQPDFLGVLKKSTASDSQIAHADVKEKQTASPQPVRVPPTGNRTTPNTRLAQSAELNMGHVKANNEMKSRYVAANAELEKCKKLLSDATKYLEEH